MNPFRLALSSLLAAAALVPLPAQNREGSSGETQKESEAAEAAKASGDAASGEVAPANPVHLANLVHSTVSTRPRRLAPSESGTLVVLFVLQHPAVVLPDAGIGLTYDTKQGDLELGPFQVVPPGTGSLETRFKGTPVHDNAVMVELPVTVGKGAPHGDLRVNFQAKIPLTDGSVGTALGEAQVSVGGQVKIGRPIPKPGLTAGGGGPVASGAAPAAAPPPAAHVEPPAAEAPRAAPAGGVLRSATAADIDRIVLSIDLPDPAYVPLGGECTGRARISVPSGLWLARGEATPLRLEVEGATDGLHAEVGSWPAPRQEEIGGKAIPVSGAEVEVPVRLTASPDAAAGLRQLAFRLTYQTVSGAEGPSAPKTLAVAAVLPVGMAATTANPWLFYGAGAVLALLLAVLLLRNLGK